MVSEHRNTGEGGKGEDEGSWVRTVTDKNGLAGALRMSAVISTAATATHGKMNKTYTPGDQQNIWA